MRHLPPRSLPAALGLLAVAATLVFAGRARASPAHPPERRGAQPAADPPRGPPAVRIAGHTVAGSIDPPDRLESLIRLLAPAGSFFVPTGAVDAVVDTPVSTEGRLRQALERLGYDPTITVKPVARRRAAGHQPEGGGPGPPDLRQGQLAGPAGGHHSPADHPPGPGAAAARPGAGPAAGTRAPERGDLPARRGLPGSQGHRGVAAPRATAVAGEPHRSHRRGPGLSPGRRPGHRQQGGQQRHHHRTAAALPLVSALEPGTAEAAGAARGHRQAGRTLPRPGLCRRPVVDGLRSRTQRRFPGQAGAPEGVGAGAQAGGRQLPGQPAPGRRRSAGRAHHLRARVVRQHRDRDQRRGHRSAVPEQGPSRS